MLEEKKESSSSRKRENAIESFERKANTKHPTRFYFMTIDRSNRRRKMQNFTAKRVVISIFYQLTQQDYLKTLILTHVHTHSPSGKKKKKVKTSKQVNGKKLLISKKRCKEGKQKKQNQHSVETSIEDSFMDFNVSFRS